MRVGVGNEAENRVPPEQKMIVDDCQNLYQPGKLKSALILI